ncbi:MAG: class I SAM-dependent methyltransferase, partial [Alphaproteobacteria bacterium]|nr:class I SAM-dependent methyltransferase [Alphaproteobacteria bacterium]
QTGHQFSNPSGKSGLRIVDLYLEINRILKPGGCFYHCDMLRPERKLVQALYSAYLWVCVSIIALVFRSSPKALACRDYFIRAVQMFHSSAELTRLLVKTGFIDVYSRTEAGGIVTSHKATKRMA